MIKELTIDSFTSVITGGTPSTGKEEYWKGGNIPWLNSGELQQDIITKSSNFITELGLKNSSTKLMPKDSVLIALTGTTTGKVGYLTFEASANQSVTGILPSKNHLPKYLYYYLNSIRKKVINDAYGGAQPHISQAYVKQIKIPLPSLENQKRIVQILDDASALRSKTKQLLIEYNLLTQSIFFDMFGDPVKNEKGWEIVDLIKLCEKITDGTHQGPKFIESGIPFLLVSNIVNNEINFKTKKFISDAEYKTLTKSTKIEIGDLLYTSVGSYGNPAIVLDDRKFCFQRHIAHLKPKHSIVNIKFLHAMMSSPIVTRQADRNAVGAAQKTLNLKVIKAFKVFSPPIELQNQFAEKIVLIEKQKELAKQELKESEDLFNCLMQKAFKGELV